MVAVMGLLVLLVAVNDGVFPVPDAASPIAGLELVQLNVAPDGVLVNADAGMIVPAH